MAPESVIERVMRDIPTSTFADLHYRALTLLGFAGAFRCPEMVEPAPNRGSF